MRNQIEKQLQVISEKLGDIAENISEVYEAGINSGGLKKISLIDLYAEGKIASIGGEIDGVTDNSILVGNNNGFSTVIDIFFTGYVEIILHIRANGYDIFIDDVLYGDHGSLGDEVIENTFHFSGRVFNKFTIAVINPEFITFERFVKGRKVLEEVFNNGQLAGEEIGANEEWNVLWDDIQDFGNRVLYNNGFQNTWSDATFRPKYDMRPTSAGYMFAGTRIADLKGCLEKGGVDGKGVTLDLSNATSVDRIFSDAPYITYIPVISTVSAPHLQNFVYNCKNLISIDELILKDDGSQTFNENSFKNCNELTEIRISGTIGSTINLQWLKKLSAESYKSIVEHLSMSATATITVPSVAPSVYDAKYGSGAWLAATENSPLVAGWTFKYA